MAGISHKFDANLTDSDLVGFAGIGVTNTPGSGDLDFGFSLEGRHGTNGYAELQASARVNVRF
ncbi:MAG: hypothetical protein GY779_05275 [Gammaproteobacteria bacterium]|nr:hypothetical protein [Gammaproteobacteria bacterium]